MSWFAQVAVTEYSGLGGLNNRHFFLIALEAGKFMIKVLTDSVPSGNPIPGL